MKKQGYLNNFDNKSIFQMHLCIDIGNSLVKTAVFSGTGIIGKNLWADIGPDEIEEIRTGYPQIKNVILCSVRPDNPDLVTNIRDIFPFLLIFDHKTAIPIENLYKSKSSLGKDRLAAVTGANNIYPGRAVLVVDAGTAITYDMIDESGRYLGGNISPGISIRFRSLHEFTGRLPLVGPRKNVPLLANNTEESIVAGVMNGIIFEMESFIGRMKEQFRDLVIIFTGGDAKYFDKKLKSTIFVDPDLIFTGLNRILTYNVEKK